MPSNLEDKTTVKITDEMIIAKGTQDIKDALMTGSIFYARYYTDRTPSERAVHTAYDRWGNFHFMLPRLSNRKIAIVGGGFVRIRKGTNFASVFEEFAKATGLTILYVQEFRRTPTLHVRIPANADVYRGNKTAKEIWK